MNKKYTRPLLLVSVKRKRLISLNSQAVLWAVYEDEARMSPFFAKGRQALVYAIQMGWQASYRGLTYNDGGYLNGEPADTGSC